MPSRAAIRKALDAPSTPLQNVVAYFLVAVIILSIVGLVVEERVEDPSSTLRHMLVALEYLILVVFGLEYLTRIFVTPRPWTYIFSAGGIIDLLALLPSLLSLFLPYLPNVAWLRVLRLFRFLRILRIAEIAAPATRPWSGILLRVGPYIGVAIAFKAVTLSFEDKAWWPSLEDLKTVLAVVGFAIGVLLATKLGSAQSRMREVETVVCQIVAVLQVIRAALSDDTGLREWSRRLETAVGSGEEIGTFAAGTVELTTQLVTEKVPEPYVLALRQQGELLINRASAGTPGAYDRFLRNVMLVYALAVIIALPGLVGFLSAALVVYVLGGMYFLIEDMDRPIDHHRIALIDADLSPLRELNRDWT